MYYKFENLNPINSIEFDCVCRAITNATKLDYYDVERKLKEVASLFDCEYLCVCCYKFLLDYVFGFTRIEEYQGKTIKEFLDKHPYGTFLIRVDGHLTYARDSVCYDTWDCTDCIVDIVWKC